MSKKSHKKVFRFIAHDSMEALGTCIAVVICKHFFRQFGITGVDMHKKHKQTIPEAMGIAAGIVLIKESGGIINEIDLSINKNIKVIASSADINSKLLEKLGNF